MCTTGGARGIQLNFQILTKKKKKKGQRHRGKLLLRNTVVHLVTFFLQ